VKAAQAANFYGVSIPTVRLWARTGQVPTERINELSHYKYVLPDISTEPKQPTTISQYIIYTRVSSKKQSDDLERQSNYLKSRYPKHQLITDIGSGINFNRTGFKTILEALFSGNIKEVVVAHKDRFSRFGFDFFTWIFSQFGAKLKALENKRHSRNNGGATKLAEDLMEIITVFSARFYGKRKYIMHEKNKVLSK